MYSIGRKIETNSGAVEHDDETIDPKTCFSDVFFFKLIFSQYFQIVMGLVAVRLGETRV